MWIKFEVCHHLIHLWEWTPRQASMKWYYPFCFLLPSWIGWPNFRAQSSIFFDFGEPIKHLLEVMFICIVKSSQAFIVGAWDFKWSNGEARIYIISSNLLFGTSTMFQQAWRSLRITCCMIRFISSFFLISYSNLWICFSCLRWVCLISSFVALIMSSWIFSIVEVISIRWSRLELYFCSTSSCHNQQVRVKISILVQDNSFV